MPPGQLVSICIPTCRRPGLLSEAVQSCLAQDYRPLEIVIGDDSPTDESERKIHSLDADPQVSLQYSWHETALGQAENVNSLFRRASGDKLMLLHDDDLLMPHAVRLLLSCWEERPDLVAAFGKQYVINHSGVTLPSEAVNRHFYRSQEFAGTRLQALESALVQQFPNDGYMVETNAARAVPYRSPAMVGEFCDFDFGIRLAANQQRQQQTFYFLDVYTAKYRLTDQALSRDLRPGNTFGLLEDLPVPAAYGWAKKVALERLAAIAIMGHARHRQRREALRIFLSESYPWSRRISPGGLKKLASIVAPEWFCGTRG